MRVEKQRLADANFSGGDMILTGQFFAVGSPGMNEFELIPETSIRLKTNITFFKNETI